jgi:hypothetical protein
MIHNHMFYTKYAISPSESLRLNRPRPRGRPTHAHTIGPIKA